MRLYVIVLYGAKGQAGRRPRRSCLLHSVALQTSLLEALCRCASLHASHSACWATPPQALAAATTMTRCRWAAPSPL